MIEGFNAKYRRITSCAAAIVIVMGLVTSSVMQVKAVTPAEATIAAALVSYVGASGVRLWREGVGSSGDTAINQMVSDMRTLWSDFVSGFDGSPPSWDSIAGVSVSNGKYLIDYDTAQSFQSFTDWLALNYNLKPHSTVSVVDNGDEDFLLYTCNSDYLDGVPGYQSSVWALPISVYPSGTQIVGYGDNDDHIYTAYRAYIFLTTTTSGGTTQNNLVCVSPYGSIGSLVRTIRYHNGTSTDTEYSLSLTHVTDYPITNDENGHYFYFNFRRVGLNNAHGWPYVFNEVKKSTNADPYYEMSYAILNGTVVGDTGDVFASVGANVANSVYDLIRPIVDPDTGNVVEPGQSLVIDVGAHADATEEELASIVGEAYVAGVDDAVIPFADSFPAPIAGVEELYPQPSTASDVENLGLPELGRALTTRFPFCIPWDVAALYKSFNATPVRPVFNIDVVPSDLKSRVGVSGDTSITLDLGDPRYDTLISIIRWGCLGGFVFGLAYATKRIIWTTGG